MLSMIKLTCHSCGGKLEITDDIERFACGHCGTEWLVNRSGGIVSLKAVEKQLGDIKKHTSQTADSTQYIALDAKIKDLEKEIASVHNTMCSLGQSSNNTGCLGIFFFIPGIGLIICSIVLFIINAPPELVLPLGGLGVIITFIGWLVLKCSNNPNIQKLRNRKIILMEEKEILKNKRDSIKL